MKKHKNKYLVLFLVSVIVLPIVLHLTPKLSVKTNLFMSGHLSPALFADIEEDQTLSKEENTLIFMVSPSAYEKSTGTQLDCFKVKKELFYYVSDYYSGV